MHLVIIGNGITGVTAALTARQLDPAARITLVSAESAHHYSRTALMYLYMGHLRYQDTKPYGDWFWAENRLELVHAEATGLDPAARQVQLSTGQRLAYDQLLLATGSVTRFFNWPGQQLRGVQGLYGLPDLEKMTRDTQGIRRAVVVGGGLIGIELAEMLHARGIHVTLLVRESRYWELVLPPEEAALVERQISLHHVELRLHTEMREVLGDADGRVRAVVTTAGEELPCQWVGIATGVAPNLALAKAAGLATDRGILVDEHLRTSVPGVYAAGDCAQHREPGPGQVPVEQLWYTGRMQGETVAHTICGQPTPYRRGLWFNSAKFFNLEYQTYGRVPAEPEEGTSTFCWQPPGGGQLLRLNFRAAEGHAVTGLNALGLRQRHAVWERWLQQRVPVQQVLRELGQANFDPEFFRRHEPAIRRAFARQFPDLAVDAVPAASTAGR
ncbi:FAD-dependent pyridine nucleotide-disulphide oxidoreductase [Hymenobacter roseosalivarius DSM 11622]|uniref:FAD-dependent pyridine nucleotide-disulphide oxidoreductase n=1 Tax=Hymenobacter roseosalivarius DSM 11622 TaxID=645990 RepID=A0A1W1UJG3_9BACT|nr:NAD(P)/FAD-dependent oxidoreductase [Hymenobacter roseosalivarius]SMB81217.1 FAD-dependent pyridine nucleotide-disulphide oxidoreductase [Hymenobacter roseosalivarius DSM 11622]